MRCIDHILTYLKNNNGETAREIHQGLLTKKIVTWKGTPYKLLSVILSLQGHENISVIKNHNHWYLKP
jgi:hypothetical protein